MTSSRLSWSWWKAGLGILVVVSLVQFLEFPGLSSSSSSQSSFFGNNNNCKNASSSSSFPIQVAPSSGMMTLVAGELPGYTGWARPEWTATGCFSIVHTSVTPDNNIVVVGQEWTLSVQCRSHAHAQLFLRAYGPAVVSGWVESSMDGLYVLHFLWMDPGVYTVEAVLEFGNPPATKELPLGFGIATAAYEGYLLPGFPLQVTVHANPKKDDDSVKKKNGVCDWNQLLTQDSAISARSKARWKVTAKQNAPGYNSSTALSEQEQQDITERGYQTNLHSLGIHMDYQYFATPHCQLPPLSRFLVPAALETKHPLAVCNHDKIHVLFIGDSVLRVQKDMFDNMLPPGNRFRTSMIELYGGYRRCEFFRQPNLVGQLKQISKNRVPGQKLVILFNTGLHDVHRLCGGEWEDDRREYLDNDLLDSGKFRCLEEYRSIMEDLAKLMRDYPADLKVFQSSTAAWPKYGNFNIQWGYGGQGIPLTSHVVQDFNEVAYEVLANYKTDIRIIDGYWITLPRPDNREVGSTGKKLSHPGLEVQSAMARIWAQLILQYLCS